MVVDASVAQSSGNEGATDLTAQMCRKALLVIRDRQMSVVLSPAIIAEWKAHQSRFARLWLHEMYGRRRVVKVLPRSQEQLRREISKSDPKSAQVMMKDLLLVEAALDSDKRILSRDAAARDCYQALATPRRELRAIHWGTPTDPPCMVWLESGAPEEGSFRLGQ